MIIYLVYLRNSLKFIIESDKSIDKQKSDYSFRNNHLNDNTNKILIYF